MHVKFNIFLQSLGLKPKNMSIYEQAFTHPSYANEHNVNSYQRMEFFGDAILEKCATEFIYYNMTKLDEGQMSPLRSAAVAGISLAIHAKTHGFQEFIKFGNKSEGLFENDNVLEDVFEAFVAALYMDLGEAAVNVFLSQNVFKFIRESKNKELKNPKTILQEFLQSESREAIHYQVKTIKDGFEAKVLHDGSVFGTGIGKSKKEAEVAAAANALSLLKTK